MCIEFEISTTVYLGSDNSPAIKATKAASNSFKEVRGRGDADLGDRNRPRIPSA